MKKLFLLFLLLGMIFVLTGCGEDQPTALESDGTQESIFDSISDALKDVFDKSE